MGVRRHAHVRPDQPRAPQNPPDGGVHRRRPRRARDRAAATAIRTIWFTGSGAIAGECLRLGLVDEVRVTVAPVLICEGIRLCEGLDRDVPLHLKEVTAYRNRLVALRHEVHRPPSARTGQHR